MISAQLRNALAGSECIPSGHHGNPRPFHDYHHDEHYTKVLTPTLRAAADSMNRLLTDGNKPADVEHSSESKRGRLLSASLSMPLPAPSSTLVKTERSSFL